MLHRLRYGDVVGLVANVDSCDSRSRCVVRVSLEIKGSWRANNIKLWLQVPGHITFNRAVTYSIEIREKEIDTKW